MREFIPFISRTPLFKGISPDELEGILVCLQARKSTYQNQEIILLEGQPVTSVGIVLSGRVQVIKEDYLGNRTIMTEIEPGNLFAETFSCAQTSEIPVTVISTADSSVLWLNYYSIITLCPAACGYHNQLIRNMLSILASKNLMLNQKMEYLAKRSTREKLLSYLSSQARQAGKNSFSIPFNRQELADYLSVDRSAMSTELSRMRDEGIVNFTRNEFELFKIR